MTKPKSNPASIVASTEADLPAIRDLAHEIWPVSFSGMISAEQIAYMLGWMYHPDIMAKEMREGGIAYDRLLVDEKLVGFTAYGPSEREGELKLYKLYVHPDHQRKGYGTLMMEHVESVARKQAYRSISLRVNRGNDAAVAAYRKNGYSVRESLVNDIGRGFVMDDYVMAKEI